MTTQSSPVKKPLRSALKGMRRAHSSTNGSATNRTRPGSSAHNSIDSRLAQEDDVPLKAAIDTQHAAPAAQSDQNAASVIGSAAAAAAAPPPQMADAAVPDYAYNAAAQIKHRHQRNPSRHTTSMIDVLHSSGASPLPQHRAKRSVTQAGTPRSNGDSSVSMSTGGSSRRSNSQSIAAGSRADVRTPVRLPILASTNSSGASAGALQQQQHVAPRIPTLHSHHSISPTNQGFAAAAAYTPAAASSRVSTASHAAVTVAPPPTLLSPVEATTASASKSISPPPHHNVAASIPAAAAQSTSPPARVVHSSQAASSHAEQSDLHRDSVVTGAEALFPAATGETAPHSSQPSAHTLQRNQSMDDIDSIIANIQSLSHHAQQARMEPLSSFQQSSVEYKPEATPRRKPSTTAANFDVASFRQQALSEDARRVLQEPITLTQSVSPALLQHPTAASNHVPLSAALSQRPQSSQVAALNTAQQPARGHTSAARVGSSDTVSHNVAHHPPHTTALPASSAASAAAHTADSMQQAQLVDAALTQQRDWLEAKRHGAKMHRSSQLQPSALSPASQIAVSTAAQHTSHVTSIPAHTVTTINSDDKSPSSTQAPVSPLPPPPLSNSAFNVSSPPPAAATSPASDIPRHAVSPQQLFPPTAATQPSLAIAIPTTPAMSAASSTIAILPPSPAVVSASAQPPSSVLDQQAHMLAAAQQAAAEQQQQNAAMMQTLVTLLTQQQQQQQQAQQMYGAPTPMHNPMQAVPQQPFSPVNAAYQMYPNYGPIAAAYPQQAHLGPYGVMPPFTPASAMHNPYLQSQAPSPMGRPSQSWPVAAVAPTPTHAQSQLSDEQRADLFSKCRNNRHLQVEELFAGGIPVDTVDTNGNQCIHIACQNNSKRMVKACLRWGADINAMNLQGNTPLHYCFAYHYDVLANYLLTKGASTSVRNHFGLSCSEGLRPPDREVALQMLKKHLGGGGVELNERQIAVMLGDS